LAVVNAVPGKTVYELMQRPELKRRCGVTEMRVGDGLEPYIFEGDDLKEGEFPFFVQVGTFEDNYGIRKDCSGFALTPHHVLTSVECVAKRRGTDVRPGIRNTYYHAMPYHHAAKALLADRYVTHPSTSEYKDAFAILEIDPEVQDPSIKLKDTACLPLEDYTNVRTYGPRSLCYQIGSGASKPQKAQPIPWSQVPQFYQKMRVQEVPCIENQFDNRFRCFHDPDEEGALCYGDTGGPTACYDYDSKRWVVVGMAQYRPDSNCSAGEVFGSWRLDTDAIKKLLMQPDEKFFRVRSTGIDLN